MKRIVSDLIVIVVLLLIGGSFVALAVLAGPK